MRDTEGERKEIELDAEGERRRELEKNSRRSTRRNFSMAFQNGGWKRNK